MRHDLCSSASYTHATGAELRAAIRAGLHTGPTAGLARGYVQANLVIVPAADAGDFAKFCGLNARACPMLARSTSGNPEPAAVAAGADLRTDVPRYRVFRYGIPDQVEPTDICSLWRDDFAGFLLGCSFTFETALLAAGLRVRHLDERCNVPMYRTTLPCRSAGRFAGPLVVSMRPFLPEQLEQVIAITARYPAMHGAPIHVGDPAAIGIANLGRPNFGDAVSIKPREVPVFWACGVTPQLALANARPEIAVTHSPGCMFITDLQDDMFVE